MKKLYSISAILLCLMLFQSCSKESTNNLVAPTSSNVINAKVSSNQSYLLNVNNSGTVSIEKQAAHYKISQTGPDEKTGQMVYQYLPSQDYSGTDEVILSSKVTNYSSDNRGGCSTSHVNDNSIATTYSTSYITIRFAVGK